MSIKILSAKYYTGEVNETGHYHDCHQILFVKSGVVSVAIRGAEYQATAGSLVILNRFEQHAVCLKSGEYHRYVLDISPKIDEKVGVEHKLFSILFNRPLGFLNILKLEEKAEELRKGICKNELAKILITLLNFKDALGAGKGKTIFDYCREHLPYAVAKGYVVGQLLLDNDD